MQRTRGAQPVQMKHATKVHTADVMRVADQTPFNLIVIPFGFAVRVGDINSSPLAVRLTVAAEMVIFQC